jgi:tetratricopeptide (TPR) repeat protein
MAGYHLSYSQVNLSIAAGISQKTDLSDAEKQNVNQLISQSIREAKVTTSLRPHDAMGWQNLGNIYANLLTAADGADKYAINSYAQAVALDSANPVLRTEFANLLVKLSTSIKDEKQKAIYINRAATEFQTAIQLKPDYASAYYNFAKLLESFGDFENAYTNMQKAISLLEPTNPDLSKANEELSALKAKVPAPSAPPSPSPSPLPNPSDI